ncbi:flagellar biosynthesis protein FlhF [Tamilnaduibacter salinus]|uniref:Flagellar biosynthesis protein FlhF n=1 Tax=Tamilnaduibacter salinus TaxID=1484056 RepID=A0A2A2I6J6_9GAMM|nr:flagellar biosynthesis protein FlhF [Tamilnaduibacter salinus]PAV27359.1 flagellar biosynthesis protein FlhF [Tamilnaduibacter salinus]
MKVRRFFAPTMAEALKMVSAEMGDDAVILSNQRVEGGVEIVTALNYDENLAREQVSTDPSGEAPSSGRVAEMQAEHHRRLEAELDRSRERIREIRERRAVAGSRAGHHLDVPLDDGAEHETEPDPQSGSDVTQSALDEMRAEIHSLRDMVRQGATPASRTDGASEQRLAERLQEYGLSPELATELGRRHGGGRLDAGWKEALRELARSVEAPAREAVDTGGILALVGPTGSGKTTTIGKMAARHVLRYGADSIALVTTDRYRVAAHEHLFVFGRILNVPVRVVDETHTLDQILDELSDRRLVLIDTAGLAPSDRGYQEQLEELANSRHPVQPHLVVAATSQPRIMKSTWHCYKMARPAGCVLTKLDEALTLGEVLGFAMETRLPVVYYTDGQKIPEDIHHAQPGPLVKLGVERLREVRNAESVAAG